MQSAAREFAFEMRSRASRDTPSDSASFDTRSSSAEASAAQAGSEQAQTRSASFSTLLAGSSDPHPASSAIDSSTRGSIPGSIAPDLGPCYSRGVDGLVQLTEVAKRYGEIQALRGVTATIDGEVIGLLGPNGAGKSTLLKSMLGLIPHEGEARVLGLSSRTESFRIRDRVGYMPEMDSYLTGMTAVELCTYAGELSGLPRTEAMQRAHAALYYAGLEEKRYLKVDGYSTGLKQRVKLAQALVHDPQLLFLDEPTNGLDPRAREEMLELILELPQKRGCSIIISTHLLPDVDRICDHVAIMHKGRMEFWGTIQDLRSGGQGADESLFDVEVKKDAEALAERLRAAGCQVTPSPPLRLSVKVPEGAGASLIFREARAAGTQVRGLELQRETLEAAFLRVVGHGV
jgi:ABC-2 type transport system ATP-binding protein